MSILRLERSQSYNVRRLGLAQRLLRGRSKACGDVAAARGWHAGCGGKAAPADLKDALVSALQALKVRFANLLAHPSGISCLRPRNVVS